MSILIAVVFAVNKWFGLSERLARRLSARERTPGRVAGMIWGSLSGFTSTLAHAGNLTTSLLFAPLAPIRVRLGVRLQRRVCEQAFYRESHALLFATSAKRIVDAATK